MKNFFLLALIIPFFGACSFEQALLDEDLDGVYNAQDICKKTPKGARVDKFGCAIDSDFDGVIDVEDKCPNTSFNIMVNQEGCPKN